MHANVLLDLPENELEIGGEGVDLNARIMSVHRLEELHWFEKTISILFDDDDQKEEKGEKINHDDEDTELKVLVEIKRPTA